MRTAVAYEVEILWHLDFAPVPILGGYEQKPQEDGLVGYEPGIA